MAADSFTVGTAVEVVEQSATPAAPGTGYARIYPKGDHNFYLLTSVGIELQLATGGALITASEALSAGDFVNVWSSSGTFRVRRADATSIGMEATGFVTTAVSVGGQAIVYDLGVNAAISGATPGTVFLATTPGGFTSTPPSNSGNAVQRLGVATSATTISIAFTEPIILA